MSEQRLVPVIVRAVHRRGGRWRVYDEYAKFAEAAESVQRLRRTPGVAWAYIPDEHAVSA